MSRPAHIQAMVDQLDASLFDAGAAPKAGVPLHPESIREGLILAGAQRELAERLRSGALLDLDAWAEAALDAGMSVAEVARLSGLSRQSLYARRG